MYTNLEESVWNKIRRSAYLIVSISLLTHTMSIVYSLMTFKEESSGFISIIVSSLTCFFISSSHLTIYGISILGCLYTAMLTPYYPRHQLYYIVAISGIIMLVFWKSMHAAAAIFRCLPGRIHASMVFGIALIILTKVSTILSLVLPFGNLKPRCLLRSHPAVHLAKPIHSVVEVVQVVQICNPLPYLSMYSATVFDQG